MSASEPLPVRKNELRHAALQLRDALPPEARAAASQRLADRVLAEWDHPAAVAVGSYLPIRSELDPRPLAEALAARGHAIALPAIFGDELQFRRYSAETPLVAQGHGTMAPGEDAERLLPLVLFVPLAAFDRRGHRIGYGGGFYDRALARMRELGVSPVTVGLAYAIQEIDEVPAEPFDVPLGTVATERDIIRTR